MRRRWLGVGGLLLIAAGLVLSAASYEVLSLGDSLTRIVKNRTPQAPRARRSAGRDAATAPRPAPDVPPGASASVSFTVTEDDLSRLLRRDDQWLAGIVTVNREVACRLADGHIAIDTRNRIRLAGLTVASYAGFSDWSLAPRSRGFGVRLNDLRLAGTPVVGGSWLVRRFGRPDGDWVLVPTGDRYRVNSLDVAGGNLTVSATVRGRA
jgi:hypothetical protein